MKNDKLGKMKFADLEDKHLEDSDIVPDERDEYPLETWYRKIRTVPFWKFTIDDVCKSCRQNLFPEQMVPIAFNILNDDQLAGEYYDGQLLLNLASIEKPYWENHPKDKEKLFVICRGAIPKLDSDILTDLKNQLRHLGFEMKEM